MFPTFFESGCATWTESFQLILHIPAFVPLAHAVLEIVVFELDRHHFGRQQLFSGYSACWLQNAKSTAFVSDHF